MENFIYKQIELELNKENLNQNQCEEPEDVEHFKRGGVKSSSESKIRSSIRKLKTKLHKKVQNENTSNKPNAGVVNAAFKTSVSNVREVFNGQQGPAGPNQVKSPFKNLDPNQLRIVSKKFGENPFKSPPPLHPSTLKTHSGRQSVEEVNSKRSVNFTKSNFKPYIKPKSPKPVLRDLRNRDFKKLNRNLNKSPWSKECEKKEIRKAVKYEIPTISDELLQNIKLSKNKKEEQNDCIFPSQFYENCDNVDQAFSCKSYKTCDLSISEIDSQISDLEKFRDQLIKWNKNNDSRDDLNIDYVPHERDEFKIARVKSYQTDNKDPPESPTVFRYIDEVENIAEQEIKCAILQNTQEHCTRESPDGADVNSTYTLPLDLDNIDINSTINIDDIKEIPNIENCEIELEEENMVDVEKENEAMKNSNEILKEGDSSRDQNEVSSNAYKTEMFKHIDIYRKPISVLDPIIESPGKPNPSQIRRNPRTDCYFKTISSSNGPTYHPEKMFEVKKSSTHYATAADMFTVKSRRSHESIPPSNHKNSLKRKRCTPSKRKSVGIINPTFNPVDQPLGSDNETFYMNESLGNENVSFEASEKINSESLSDVNSTDVHTSNADDDKFPLPLETKGNHKNLESFLGFDPETNAIQTSVEMNYLREGGIVNPNFDMNDPQNFKRNVRFNDSICILNENENSKKSKKRSEPFPLDPHVPLKSNLKYKPEVQPFCGINSEKLDRLPTHHQNQLSITNNEEFSPNESNGDFFVINTTNPFFSDILKQEISRTTASDSKDLQKVLQSKHQHPSETVEPMAHGTKRKDAADLDSTYTIDDGQGSKNPFEKQNELRIDTDMGPPSLLPDLSDSLSPDTLKHVCLPLTYVPQSNTESKKSVIISYSENYRKIQHLSSLPLTKPTKPVGNNRTDNVYFLSINRDENFYPKKQADELKNPLTGQINKNHFLDKQHDENFYEDKISVREPKDNASCNQRNNANHNPVKMENHSEQNIHSDDIDYKNFEKFLNTNQSFENFTHFSNTFLDSSQTARSNETKTFSSFTMSLPSSQSEENLSRTVNLKKITRKTLKRSSTQNNCRMNIDVNSEKPHNNRDNNRKGNRSLRRTKSLNEYSRKPFNRMRRSNSTGHTLGRSYSYSNSAKLLHLDKNIKENKRKQHRDNWKQYERRQFEPFDRNSIKVFKDFEEAIDFHFIPVSFYTNKNDTTEYDVSHIVEKFNDADCRECQQKQLMNESGNSNKTKAEKHKKQSQTNRDKKKATASKAVQRNKKGIQVSKYNFMKLKYPTYKVNKTRLNVSHNKSLQRSSTGRRSLRRFLKKYTSNSESEAISSFNLHQNKLSIPIGKYTVTGEPFYNDIIMKGESTMSKATSDRLELSIPSNEPILSLSKRNPCSSVKNCDFLGDHTCEKIADPLATGEVLFSRNPNIEPCDVGEKQIDRLSNLINELRRNSYRGRHGNRRNHLWTPRYEEPDDMSCLSQTKAVTCEKKGDDRIRQDTCQSKSSSTQKIHDLDAKLEHKFKSSREKDHLNCSIIFFENPVYERLVKSEENVSTNLGEEVRKENYAKKCHNARKPRMSLGFEIERRGEGGGDVMEKEIGGYDDGDWRKLAEEPETRGPEENIITISSTYSLFPSIYFTITVVFSSSIFSIQCYFSTHFLQI